ncbi:hypothetical protein HMN09_00984700 [Mycena chlorophos]|uniref:Rad4-domain-containing protein n=1 Tax=Mycena chlorophos TaxID=658473 RepID=A0A8H6SK48_MYCCL|nr:hypothetical protein HMN09_00984700 [Mycena chlorophos]
MSTPAPEPSSDSEGDWEEIVPADSEPSKDKTLEITISLPHEAPDSKSKPRISPAERLLRINCHKLHTLALLANAWVRNRWINDELLQARLVSLTPMALQTAFAMIHKSRIPDVGRRGRMFETALRGLVDWWSTEFYTVAFEGHLRSRTFDDVRRAMGDDQDWDTDALREMLDDDGETVRGPKSLMKYALKQRGTRDMSAQLFTALCRGLGIPARLVVSLQSAPWQTPKAPSKGKGKAKAPEEVQVVDPKGKGKAKEADVAVFPGGGQRLDGGTVAEPSEKTKGKAPIKLRKQKDKGNVLGVPSTPSTSAAVELGLPLTDPATTPPVFWTEVFSRPDGRWFPVDPIRNRVNQPKDFDPATASGDPATLKRIQAENRLVYVLAFEDDGFARDVTRRYAKRFTERVVKMQGARQAAWWARVVEGVTRPYRLNRDDVEDAELDTVQLLEGMPTTIAGFKDHPMYVLTRHLTQTQTIHPPPPLTREVGKFRGEPVYPRSAVVSLKTAENWLRSAGRSIREGEQPLKLVKARATTLGRMREVAVLKDGLRTAGEDDQGEVMTGLYAFSQTELYVPDPVVDGVIPKNNFGNIDLYVPSMLPAGAAHIPYKGTAKLAKQLGFDYAEAVIGFEFRNRRATPVINGIVVAEENESAILEAYWEAEQDAAAKARAKKRDRVLKRWVRLVHGLRIRQSLQEEYKDRPMRTVDDAGEVRFFFVVAPPALVRELMLGLVQDIEIRPGLAGGGFLDEADAVVQAFRLPKAYLPAPDGVASGSGTRNDDDGAGGGGDDTGQNGPIDYAMDVDPEDVVVEDPIADPDPEMVVVPKTMQQLAEETAAKLQLELAKNAMDEDELVFAEPVVVTKRQQQARGKKAQQARNSNGNGNANGRKPATAKGTTSAKSKAKAKVKTTPTRRGASVRKRRRRRDGDTEDEEEEDDEHDASEDEDVEVSPAKRARTTTAPAPTRMLRPRRASTKAVIDYDETGDGDDDDE